MSLEAFLNNLHFDIDRISPPDWEVNWDDAPLPYKLYRGLPAVNLSLEVPLTLEGGETPVKPNHFRIGHFLWYVYGLTQFSQSVLQWDDSEKASDLMQSFRRFVPSGGALYPNELYVYLKLDDLPTGVYHYDVAHHRLLLLREGNFDSYIARALGNRCEVSSCFGTVFVSTMFWKNFYKYNNFAYRLQGLDTGVLIGQLLEVAKHFGFATGVYFQFLDRAINHLLGLSNQEESVYAVIPLSVEMTFWSTNCSDKNGIVSEAELCRELPSIITNHYVRSQKVKAFPMLTRMNEACIQENSGSFRLLKQKERLILDGKVVSLPTVKQLSSDFSTVCKKRFSPNLDFVLGKVSPMELAKLLQEATTSFVYRNDLDEIYSEKDSRISLYICLYNVEGIQNGAYQYDLATHTLQQVNLGDHRIQLQSALSGDNVNLFQVPLCIHVAGDRDFLKSKLGYRGYRIQQMEAGMLVQQLLLSAATIGMGGHPLLGFDSNLCDKIYRMDLQGRTSLIQVPIGPYRQRSWLIGSLHC